MSEKSSIAEKTAKLNELIAWFDGDDFELEKAIDMFSQAEKLAQEIEKDLLEVKNKITVLSEKFEG